MAESGSEISQEKHRVLKELFGFGEFRAGQEQAVDALLAGRNVLTVMPTGSGKSLCFQVPALILKGLSLVVSPLVALMHDQVAALQLIGIAADTINSSRSRDENIAVWQQVRAGALRLLYLSPERLMTSRMLAALSVLDVKLIAVDEAHCISRWGPAFRPDYENLAHLRQHFPHAPIAALTATADESTRQDICTKLFAGTGEVFVLGFDRPNITLQVEPKQGWKTQLLGFLQNHKNQSGIIYCLSRKKCEQAAEYLNLNGFRALVYHAGMDKEVRDLNQNTFMSEAGTVMVATIAFGMGIDKADVRFVFHTDLPGNMETYYQEIGRAGRDGAPAVAHMLFGLEDIRMRRMFIEEENSDEDRKRREHKRLEFLVGYCETPQCRRQSLLAYFGETSAPCGNCDICLNPVERIDGTKDAKKILSAVFHSGQLYGAVHIVEILRGSLSQKIVKARHDELPAFGTGKDQKVQHWRALIRQLVASGNLALDIKGYGGLSMTEKGFDLLQGDAEFHYRPDRRAVRKESRPPVRKDSAAGQDKTARRKDTGSGSLRPEHEELLAKLKNLRLELARAKSVPAFVIFPDRTLNDMVEKWPLTEAEFANVNGVGEKKLKELAGPFLEVLRR